MADLDVEPAFVRPDDGLTTLRSQHYAPGSGDEVCVAYLPVVQHLQDDRVGDQRTELLGQVEGQGRSSEPWCVQDADERVEPDAETDRYQILDEQSVAEAEQAVDRVTRRSAVATVLVEAPCEGAVGVAQHGGEVPEVDACGCAS